MDAAEFPQDLWSWTKQQMIGVDQKDACAGGLQALYRLSLHGRLGSHRHKDRRFDLAMESLKRRRSRLRSTGLSLTRNTQARMFSPCLRIIARRIIGHKPFSYV